MVYKDKGLIYSEYVLNYMNMSDYINDNNLYVSVETFYNCREQGYVFNVHNSDWNNRLYIWVYAHRNSDEPTIVWGKEIDGNNMFNEEEWLKQQTFENINDAVVYVEKIIKENI